MSSSGLKTTNFQIMTNDNKQQKLSDSTEPAIAYSTCYVQPFSEVFNEDCIQVMKRYPDKFFDLAVVDPPYGLGDKLTQGGTWASKYAKGDASWDIAPPDEYWEQLFRVSKNQIVWGGNYFHNLHLTGVIVWNKKGSGNFKEGELAKTSLNTFKVFDYSRADAYINDCDMKIHPTQKPVKLYEWIYQHYTKEGDLILDTHCGSGSSRIAADLAGLSYVGFEIDKTYFDAQEKRFNIFKSQLRMF